jgi:hypothetical protein
MLACQTKFLCVETRIVGRCLSNLAGAVEDPVPKQLFIRTKSIYESHNSIGGIINLHCITRDSQEEIIGE